MSLTQDAETWSEALSAFDWDADLICVCDLGAGTIEAVSAAWTRWSGWTEEDLLGQNLGDLVHPEDRGLIFATSAQVLRVRQRAGDWQRVRWQPLPGAARGRLVALARPVIAEGQPAPFETLGDGVIVFDAQDRITFANGPIRALMEEQGIPVGAGFLDLMRNALDRGAIVAARGQEVAWLTEFAAAREVTDRLSRDVQYAGDRWIRYTDHRIDEGGRFALRMDVTELYRRKDMLEAVVTGAAVGTWDHDFGTGLSTCNPQFAAMLGLPHAEFSPYTLAQLAARVHPEDLPALHAARQGHLAGERPNMDVELRLRRADGNWLWARSRRRVVARDAEGRPLRASGVMIDLSEVKAMEARLRASERLLAKTGEAARVGGFELDLVTMAVTLTPQMRAVRGLPPDAAPDFETAVAAYAPASQVRLRAAVRVAQETGQELDLDLELVRADGKMIRVRALASVDWQDGRPARLYGAILDISDRVARQRDLEAKQQRMVLATEGSGIGIWQVDLATQATTWDSQMFRIYGQAPGQEAGALFAQALHPEDHAAVQAKVEAALAAPHRLDAEFRILRPDGSQRHIHAIADPVIDPQIQRPSLLGVNMDVTPLRRMAADLAVRSDLLRVTLRAIGEGVITTDATGTVTWLNPAAETLTGWPLVEAQGRPLAEVFALTDEESGAAVPDPVRRVLDEGRAVEATGRACLTARGGVRVGIEERASPIRDDRQALRGAVLVFHDVTQARRERREIDRRASQDSLTGALSRSEFDLRLAAILQETKARGEVHSLLTIDLDRFKQVNDACGHATGDTVLRDMARIMAGVIRAGDLIGRLGGDEFAVVLRHCPPKRGRVLAEDIVRQVGAYRFEAEGRAYSLGASVGLIGIDERWETPDQALQAADTGCLAAKAAGRGCVRLGQGEPASK